MGTGAYCVRPCYTSDKRVDEGVFYLRIFHDHIDAGVSALFSGECVFWEISVSDPVFNVYGADAYGLYRKFKREAKAFCSAVNDSAFK